MDGFDYMKKMKFSLVSCFILCCFLLPSVRTIPKNLLYAYDVGEVNYLPKGDDVSSGPIDLNEPLVFFGVPFDTIYVSKI